MKVTILLLSCLVLATEARSYASLSDLFQAASIARSDSQVEEPVNSIQQLQAQQQQQPVAEASNYDLQMPQYVQTRPSYQTSGGAQVSAAIQSKRTVEVKPVSIQQDPVEPHVVDVEASYQPVQVVFRSSSSPVMVQQIHTPSAPMQLEATQSEDEPHRVQHQVMRPVIQEIREIIQPYRRVLQEIRPVLEEVRTVVAKASDGNSAQVAPGSAIGVGSGLGGLGGGIGNAGGNGAGAGGLAGGLGAGQGYGGSQGAGQGYGGSQGAGQGYGGGQGGQSGGRYAGSGYDGQQNSRSSRGGNLRKSYSRRSGSLSKSRYQSNIQQYAARS